MKTVGDRQSQSWGDLLPKYWKADRLGKFADIIVSNVDKKTEDDEEPVLLCNYVDVYKNDRITAGMPFMEASATPHEIAKFTLLKDDVITTKDSESPLDIAIPSLVVEDIEGLVCGYHLAILRADRRNLFGPYLSWLHVSQTIRSHYEMHACGITRWAVGRKHFKTCPVPLPPLAEQQRIAAYLDASCAAIDRAVETKRKQLETLDALRKSIIQKAVTQGLNPKVKMKESGVDYLGQVPAHWEVARIKRHTSMIRGKFSHRPRNDPALYGGPYPFFQTGSIASAEKYITEYKQTLNEDGLAVSRMFPKGIVVMSIAANIGDVAITGFEGCFPDSIVGFIPDHHTHTDYLFYLLKSMKHVMLRSAILTTQLNLNYVRIGANCCAFPPKREQEEIANFLESKMDELSNVASVIDSQITTLTAYRKSLIHECVTGKRRISVADVAKVEAHV